MSDSIKLGRFEKISRNILIASSKMLKDAKTELFQDIHGKVLEVGAGVGVNVFFLNRPEVTHWKAVEPDSKLAHECRIALSEMGDKASVFDGYLHEIDDLPNSYDCIIFTTLLCSVPNPDEIVRDAHRLLKPGGKLYLIEHVGDKFGVRAGIQVIVKYPWKFITGCNCRNNPISSLSQEGLWEGIDGDVKMISAPLRVKKFSPLVELLKPFVMTTLTKAS
tara:strand:+ start:203 stop:862 length:660 start_codon:yes stop_codon:yes gene_type:complete